MAGQVRQLHQNRAALRLRQDGRPRALCDAIQRQHATERSQPLALDPLLQHLRLQKRLAKNLTGRFVNSSLKQSVNNIVDNRHFFGKSQSAHAALAKAVLARHADRSVALRQDHYGLTARAIKARMHVKP